MKIKSILFYCLLFPVISIFASFIIEMIKVDVNRVEFFVVLLYIVLLFFITALIQIFCSVPLLISDKTVYGKCENDKKKDCCVKEYIKSLKQSDKIKDFVLSDELLKDYKLISTADMNKMEKKFILEADKVEIWVFSHDLHSETLGDESQNIVIDNIKNGLKYIEFFIDNEKTKEIIEKNKISFIKKIPRKYIGNVEFKHIKENENIMNILPHLLGSIIFVNKKKIKSYFSLRGDGNKENAPIYFEMPRCMSKRYHKYFKKLK